MLGYCLRKVTRLRVNVQIKYLQRNKEKYNQMSRERNQERYYTDEEYRQKIIERAKLSVYKKRMELKNMI